MNHMNQIILASKNKGKIKEFNELLNTTDYQCISMEDAGFKEDIEEGGKSLSENAFLKAQAIFQQTGIACLSEDSGLFIEALDGEPGIFSARYGGNHKNDVDNIALVLKMMSGKSNRRAYFEAILCFIQPEGKINYFKGKVHGQISDNPMGDNGFGYDPIFIPDGFQQTFAELGNKVKNDISHRAIAAKKFQTFIL